MRITLVILFFFASIFQGYAQTKLDSLYKVYVKAETDNKSIALLEAGKILLNSNLDSAKYVLHKSYKEAVLIKDKLNAVAFLGKANTYLGQYKEADSILKSALSEQKNNDYELESTLIMNIGINYFYQGRYKEAGDEFMKFYEMAKSANVPSDISKGVNNLGLVYMYNGNNEKALVWLLKAAKIDESSNELQSAARVYNNIAMVNERMKNFGVAKKYYIKSLNIKLQGDDKKRIYSGYNNLGILYKNLSDYDSALWYCYKALDQADALNYLKGKQDTYSALAVIYNMLENHTKAIEYSSKALKLARESTGKEALASSLLNNGDAYRLAGKLKVAEPLIKEGLEKSLEINNKEFIKEGYLMLSQLYYDLGNYKSAYTYHTKYKNIYDSLLNDTNLKQVAELQTIYETEKKDNKLLVQSIELKRNEVSLQLQIVAIAFLLLIIFIIYWRFNLQRKQQRIRSKLAINEERNRIAMDLHDHVGAELTLVNSKLDTRVFKSEIISEKEDLEDISNQIRDVSKTLRETVWSIQEEAITIEQLLARIQGFADKQLAETSIEYSATTNEVEFELTPQIALTLYRICQESITNSLKYANCSSIKVSIAKNNKILDMDIADNGDGFDVEKVSSGYGLINIKQRAEKIGGEFNLLSAVGNGATIHIKIPV